MWLKPETGESQFFGVEKIKNQFGVSDKAQAAVSWFNQTLKE